MGFIDKCLLNAPLLKDLSTEEKLLIRNNMYETSYKSREVIFKQGVPLSHVIFNSEGYAKIYIEGLDDKEVILTVFSPLSYLSGPGLFYGGKFNFSAMALSDVKTCFIDKKVFIDILNSNNAFSAAFLSETARRSIGRINSFMNIIHKKTPGKMAGVLVFLTDVVYKSRSFDALLSRKELGDFTGMSKESAIRILTDFKKDGIINFEGSCFEILDYDKLQKINRTG